MGGIVSKLFGRGYKLNDPGLSTDDTTIKEKQGHSKEGGKSSKQQGKAPPRPPRPSSTVEDAPKHEQPEKGQASQPSPADIAATVAVGLIEKAISGEKAPEPEKDTIEKEKPKETKPEPAPAYQPVVDVLQSTAEAAAREAAEAFQKALAGEEKVVEQEPVKHKEEEKLPEPPPVPYQPVVDVLKSTAEVAVREASEAFQKALADEQKAAEPEPVKQKEEEKLPEPPPAPYQPVADVLKTSGEVAASVAGEIFEKVVNLVDDKSKVSEEQEQKIPEPVPEVKPAEPEQKPFLEVVKDTASEITSNVVSGLIETFSTEQSDASPQAPKEPPKEAPPPPPKDEPDQEPQQPFLGVLRSTATVAASDLLNKWTSNEDDSQKQEEKKDVEEERKEQDESSPLVDVLKSSTRAAVSFASGLLDSAPPTEEPITDKEPEKEPSESKPKSNESEEQGVLQGVTDMTRAEVEAVAAKLVEEVKAKAEEQVQRMMADKENAVESTQHLSIPDSGKGQQCGDRDRSPTPNEIESAVVKIQAGVRGYLTRKMLHDKSPQHHDDVATHNGSQEHASDPKTTVSESEDLVRESHDSRLQDTHDGRTEEQQGSFLSRMSERVVDELSNLDPHYTEMAATKIQAAFRGYRVRKEMKPDNGPHALHRSEVAH